MANGTDYVATGDVFIQGQQYAKAKPYLLKALHSESYHPLVVEQALIEYYLFLCDSAEGNYISAIRHLDLNKMLDDSSNKISRNKEIQRLDIQFQTEKKETDLKLKDQNIQLLTQKSQVQQADLHQANLIKDITIAGILLLLAGGGLLFRQYRQKQRASQIISSQNELISRKNELLEHLVSEKDWLLKEVHHRVKNNLHTVICLLESQAYYLENDALNAIATTQHRIYAMSLIHQKIYQSEDIKTLDMANYMSEFIQYLRDSFGGLSRIRFMLDIESLTLGVSQAIPVALIVNEAVTNSIKYAFPMNTWGEIAIQLHQTGGQVRLSVSDNGVGIDPEIKNTEPNSLGIQLMKGLSREIYGTFSFESGKGVRILVLFDQDPLGETVTAASPIVNILR
jgi:two-component system, sensor histidine kinase PdtaS